MKQQESANTGGIHDFSRREFLETSAGAAAIGVSMLSRSNAAHAADAWNQGQLAHLIPAATHDRFLIKASFTAPLARAPSLTVNGKSVAGAQTDPQGRFWRFDAPSLQPATQYELRIVDAGGAPLCDAWPLKTFPAPDAAPERLRILAYTCAGGYDDPPLEGKTTYLDMAARRRLLARGMSHQPDVVIANGDHIYWDMTTAPIRVAPKYVKEQLWAKFGELDLCADASPEKHRRLHAYLRLPDCRTLRNHAAIDAGVLSHR